jgi:hypothetical protein
MAAPEHFRRGARALARFTMDAEAVLAISIVSPQRELKRRKRRAPHKIIS